MVLVLLQRDSCVLGMGPKHRVRRPRPKEVGENGHGRLGMWPLFSREVLRQRKEMESVPTSTVWQGEDGRAGDALFWGPPFMRIKPACLIVSKGTGLHTHSLPNCASPRRAALERLPRTKFSMGWADSAHLSESWTPTPWRFPPMFPLFQTPWTNFNQDGPFRNIKGWLVCFP